MSDQLNLDQDAQPRLRLAAQVERPQAAAAKSAPAPAPAPLGFVPQDVTATVETHLLDYVKVLYKRRWMAATAFLLVVLGVTVYTFTMTPIFEARTRLLIEAENPNVVSFKEVIDEDQTKADYYQTQYNILQSRVLARKTIENLKLWDHPLLAPKGESKGFSVSSAATGAAEYVTGIFKSETVSTGVPAADETAAQSKTIDAFLEDLTVAPIRNSRLVDVKFRAADPALATTVVNALAKNYIEQNLEYKFLASKEATDWLGERLAEQRKQVETAESKLQAYREQNDAISLQDRENIVVQKLADLNAAVTRAKTERIQKESMYSQLRSIQDNAAALDTFPAILTNTFIQQQKAELAQLQRQHAQLSEKLGDKHPDIIKVKSAIQGAQLKLQTEIGKIVESVRNEYQAAQAQENSLAAALGQQKGEALSMNRKAIDYSVLDREVQSSKQLYESLMQRAKETGISGELKTSNIRVVDHAERPRAPIAPRKLLNMSLGLLGGTMLAFGLAFFFEYLDSRIKTPDEIKIHLGLPSLGMVPALDAEVVEGQGAADQRRRAAGLRRGVPHHPHERAVLVGGRGLAHAGRHQHRPRRGQDHRRQQPRDRLRAGRPAGAAHRRRHAPSARAPGVRPRAGAGTVEPDGRQRQGERERAQDAGSRTVGAGLGPHPAEPGGAARLAAVPGLPDLAQGALRPDHHRLAAGHGGHRRGDRGERGLRRDLRRRRRDDQPARGARRGRAARTGRANFVGAILNRVELERNAYYYSHYYRREYGAYYQQAVNAK